MKDRNLYLMGCLFLAAAFAGLIFLGIESSMRVNLDKLSCPQDSGYLTSVTAFVIDGTDALPEFAATQVKRTIREEVEKIRNQGADEYGLLEVRAVTPGEPGGKVIFEKCASGKGGGLDEWKSNARLLDQIWEQEFKKRMDEADPFSGGEAATSPIMATIQAFAFERFGEKNIRDIPKRLFIVSDMLEHGPDYSHYRDGFSYEKFRSTLHHKATKTDLHGAEVFILYVQRRASPSINQAKHKDFWGRWLEDNNGRPKVNILQGLN